MLGKASEIKTYIASNYIKMRDFLSDYPNFNIIDIKYSAVTSSMGHDAQTFLIIYKEATA